VELLVEAVDFVRRRLEGDYAVDEFGFDPELTERVMLNVLRPVYRRWFRVELRGEDRIPADRGALLVGNHSGTLAWDALMTQVAVHDSTGGRFLRLLGADLVFATPVVGDVARRIGATLAASSDAERLLSSGSSSGCGPRGSRGSARTTATGTGCSASVGAASSRPPSARRSRSSR
jgi:1-acyl-sn-glycerol-3-phosphate acyltransferase